MSDTPTPDTDATPETPEAEADAPETDYAPTVVNPQAHEPIQAGERAQVGQTIDVPPAD